MLTRFLSYLRQHAIATLALICSLLALAGSSYAALTISGTQIRNRTITAVKLDPRSISGSVKAWANLQQAGDGKIFATSSSSPVRIQTLTNGEVIVWKRLRFSPRCTPVVTPAAGPVTGAPATSAELTVDFGRNSTNELAIFGHVDGGPDRPVPASLAMICP